MMDFSLSHAYEKNAVTRVVESFEVSEQSSVLSDEMILIGNTQNRAENVFRRIEILDPNGKELYLITNRFDLSADEVAELYKSRWAIELFFKWMKQHLNIKKILRAKRASCAQSGVHCDDRILLKRASTASHKQFTDVSTN